MNIDDLRSDPIKIESITHGVLEFLELMLKDMSWLDLEQTKELRAREFIIQVIYRHLLMPKLGTQEIREWEDAELSLVSAKWLGSQWKKKALPDAASFDEIKDAIYAYYNEITAEAREMLDDVFASQKRLIESISEAVAPSLSLASSHLTSPMAEFANVINFNLLNAVFQKALVSTQLITDTFNTIALTLPHLESITSNILNTTQLFAGFPDLTELDKLLKEAEEGRDAFEKAGYGFIMSDYVSVTTARHFASIHPKIRSATITSQLTAETRKPAFEEKLKSLFEKSSVLRRRWPIVLQALKAHRRREYNISIPPILAQIEGIVGDALIFNGLVARNGHQLFEKKDGKLKLDKNKKPIAIRGVGTLIQRSSWQTHPALQGVADLITTQLAGERNHILHGRKTNYGAAKLSVQGLLLLLVLGAQLIVFETGKDPWAA